MAPWPPVPGISASLEQGALTQPMPSITLGGAGELGAPARLLPPGPWAKKVEAGRQTSPLHPYLHESWPVSPY